MPSLSGFETLQLLHFNPRPAPPFWFLVSGLVSACPKPIARDRLTPCPTPREPAGYRVGIVDPVTLVGNEIKSILRERSFPHERLVLLDATGKAGGALTEIGNEPAVVLAVSDEKLEDCDVVFFCNPASTNGEWIERAEDDNFIAVDLSQPAAADGAPLAVAGSTSTG